MGLLDQIKKWFGLGQETPEAGQAEQAAGQPAEGQPGEEDKPAQ